MNNVIQKFEYESLYVGENGFKKSHFDALTAYNDKHNSQFFTVGNKKVVFKSYVGVIYVAGITIEILPKGDRYTSTEKQKKKWQNALVNLLSECKKINLKSIQSAKLNLQNLSLLEFYLNHFLNEVDDILRHGYMRRYGKHSGQKKSLKGALHFPKHIASNYIHKERFYTNHQVFDYNHPLNQILKTALNVLLRMNISSSLAGKAQNLDLRMEGVDFIHPNKINKNTLHFDRRVSHYENAIQLALMIIKEYSPTLQYGQSNVIAFLFNMNDLFEEFIYRRLRKEEYKYNNISLSISDQVSKKFWAHKTIRPDILMSFKQEEQIKNLIIDTKWKLMDGPVPSDADLKQMFVYNLYFSSDRSILLYPNNGLDDRSKTEFQYSDWVQNSSHGCEMKFINPFTEDGKINADFASHFIEQIVNN